jgi:hypothetical protein
MGFTFTDLELLLGERTSGGAFFRLSRLLITDYLTNSYSSLEKRWEESCLGY